MATYEVKGIFSICLILCVLEGSYFLLFWHNKQIIFTWNEIIYRSIFGIEKKYSWEEGQIGFLFRQIKKYILKRE